MMSALKKQHAQADEKSEKFTFARRLKKLGAELAQKVDKLRERKPEKAAKAAKAEKVPLGRKLKKLGSELALKVDLLHTDKNKGDAKYIKTMYDLFWPLYDLVFPRLKDYIGSARHLVDHVVKDGNYVLDVGTGTGVLSLMIAERGNSVIGFDLHPKMLARTRNKARKAAKKNGNISKLTLCRGDATVLPFQDGVFDVVTSGFMLVHLSQEQKRAAVTEMRRVLRPGGQLALLESRGELTKRYDTRQEWERTLRDLGFVKPGFHDIYDVYRCVFALRPQGR